MGEQAAKVPPKKVKASSSNTQLTKTAHRRKSLLPQKKQMKQTTPSKKN